MADLSFTDFNDYSELQEAYIAAAGGRFVNTQIRLARAKIYDQLRTRYDIAAMKASEPDIVKKWIAEMVSPMIYAKRGVDPTDMMYSALLDTAKNAAAEVKEAADAKDGAWSLPIAGSEKAATRNPRLRSYSESTPYKWIERQAARRNNGD